ncbi:stabilizer of axonemal microtubules 2-like isoform X1 [Haliotis rubra]|uniref:stabilizer of axonemal microtubules 2-like isoform X1 n=2 Tax=Haliotis rubra TaxID=36100 RepID=UPI001EE5C83C|nr:stabilizer of axonemal microtubules 2-like isoform X1 [Haliotis rubra]
MSQSKPCSLDNFVDDFPENVNIADLCDCGRHKKMGRLTKTTRRHEKFPVTDYQATFQAVQHPRPRSSKRPPPSPPPENAGKPMFFETNQRFEFRRPTNVERVKPIVQEDKYERLDIPLDATTSYQKEFIPKQAEPEIRVYPMRDKLKMSSAKFESSTTNKQHYKHWVPQPSVPFGELPSFAGSILFPEKDYLPESTTKNSFLGRFAPPADQVRPGITNIKIEGEMNFDTTHNRTFQNISGDHRVKPITNKPDLPLHRRERFNGESQSKRDFPGFMSGQPLPPKPAEPAPATIDLRFDNKRNFQTEQRSTFKGHDVVQHPAPIPCRKEDEAYVPSAMKFESETSQRRDFRPIDVSQNTVPKAVAPTAKLHTSPDVKFDGRTSNKDFFRDWGVAPRVRYGDFHENRPYVPPVVRFEGESVTKSTFVPKYAEPARSFKPETAAKDTQPQTKHSMDYSTAYSETFQPKRPPVCKAQAYLIQQELKRRNAAVENPEMANSLVFAK